MTLYKGTVPSGPGDITVYRDESTELFKSNRLVERVLISNHGHYSLPLPKAGTYIVEVRTSTYHYPRFTVTATAGLTVVPLPTLPTPTRRGAPVPFGSASTPSAGGSGVVPRSAVTVSSSAEAVLPYLPQATPLNDVIRTVNQITVNDSSAYPMMVSWTEDSLQAIRVVNPADSGTDLLIGVGTYGSVNAPAAGTFETVAPGSEWVGTGVGAKPVFVRCATAGKIAWPIVITVRSA